MDLEFTCDKCRSRFTVPNLIGGTASVYMEGNRVSCPVPGCSGWGHHKPGTYEFVNGVVAAFKAPGMTLEKVAVARGVASKASSGDITTEEAIQRLEAISVDLSSAIVIYQNRNIDWGLILGILVALYTIWSDYQSDAAVQSAIAESRIQTAVAQKLLEESQKQSDSLHKLATGLKRRGDIRREAAIERKQKKRKH